jgi:hypothetical protein
MEASTEETGTVTRYEQAEDVAPYALADLSDAEPAANANVTDWMDTADSIWSPPREDETGTE